jgi:hypothetical protein
LDANRTAVWKWVAVWFGPPLLANAPWLANQVQAVRAGAPVKAPEGWELVWTCVGLVGASLAAFWVKVWKELEADAVRGAARMLTAAPGATRDLLGRCWDALAGMIGRRFTWFSFTRRYLEELRYKYGLFNDKGLGLINANRLDLEKVYVDLKASADPRLNRPNLNPVSRELRDRAPVWDHLRVLRPGFALVIIGPPGCGKTTLLQHILLTFASNRQWRHRVRARVPFFVEVREIARQLQAREGELTLPELLEAILRRDRQTADVMERLPEGWLEKTLRSGKAILLWDGLDEVADLKERDKVAKWLDRAIESAEWRSNISLVTARPAGYQGAPLDRPQVLVVQPFGFEDTQRFIRQWYHASEVVSSGNKDDPVVRRRAADEARRLLTALQDNPRLGDLTSNPLLLTMICMVHRYHGALPGSRGQLYAEICQVLLERWRQQRGLTDPYSGNQKFQVLRPLAAWMMDHQTREIATDLLLEVIADPLGRIGVRPGREPAVEFLKSLQEGSGLLIEREVNTWGFAHLSFQEFLCADGWASQPASTPRDWGSRVAESWWREALLLYASRAADATPLVASALDHGAPQALALVMQLAGEKLNLDVTTRERIGRAVSEALRSHDEETFRPAGEAWLLRQQEANYHRLDEVTEISGWVTQAEFQAFLQSDLVARDAIGHVPANWSRGWFQGDPDDPILGVSSRTAQTYVRWLNERFSTYHHRLPRPTECKDGSTWLTWCDQGDHCSLHGKCPMEVERKLAAWLEAHPKLVGKADAGAFGLALDRNLALARDLGRDRAHELALALAHALDLDRDLDRDLAHAHALALDRDLNRDRARDRDLALAFGLDRACDLDLDRARALDLALDLDLALARDLDRDRAHALNLAHVFDFDLALVLAQTLALDLARDLDFDLDRALNLGRARDRSLDRDLDRDLDRARDRARDFAHDLARDRDLDHALGRALSLALGLALALNLARALDRALDRDRASSSPAPSTAATAPATAKLFTRSMSTAVLEIQVI